MTKFWKSKLVLPVACLVSASMLVSSCVDNNDRTGNSSFIPVGGDLSLYQHSIDNGFEIKTIEVDSISTSNLTTRYIGSMVTTREGQINLGFASQIAPYSEPPEDSNTYPFGSDFVVDSAYFSMGVDSYMGSTGKLYNIYVYELQDSIPYQSDSVYYSNFDIEKYIADEPTFTIQHTHGDQISYSLPVDYASKFMNLKREQYTDIDEFQKEFFGFYIKTDKTQEGMLLNSFDPSYTGLSVYYHNASEPDSVKSYTFDFREYTYEYSYYYYTYIYTQVNSNLATIDRDYSFKDPVLGVNYTAGEVSEISYVSGLAGLNTVLEIPQSIIDEIKGEVAAKGGTKIMVSNATLTIPCGDRTIDGMDNVLPALGMYKQYQPIKDMSYYNSSDEIYDDGDYVIPDYSSRNGTLSSLGGVLSRSNENYTFNISSTIQGLVNEVIDDRVIEIAPGYDYTSKESYNVSVLENSAERPITLDITYIVL